MAAVQYYATGRRKTSTARVFLRPGSGAISVNSRSFEMFFPTQALRPVVCVDPQAGREPGGLPLPVANQRHRAQQ